MTRTLAGLAVAALLAAGCSPPNARDVSPGDVVEVYDPKIDKVIGWKKLDTDDGEDLDLVEIPIFTRVEYRDSGWQIRGGKRARVRFLDGPDRGATVYVHKSYLRPVRR